MLNICVYIYIYVNWNEIHLFQHSFWHVKQEEMAELQYSEGIVLIDNVFNIHITVNMSLS